MKWFSSAGGQVEVRLGDTWIVEPDGNGVLFYDPRPGSGTLRLSVLTFQGPPDADCRALLKSTSEKHGVALQPLPNGFWFIAWDDQFEEDGLAHRLRTWRLVGSRGSTALAPVFSYSREEAGADDPANVAELAMVEQAIRELIVHF